MIEINCLIDFYLHKTVKIQGTNIRKSEEEIGSEFLSVIVLQEFIQEAFRLRINRQSPIVVAIEVLGDNSLCSLALAYLFHLLLFLLLLLENF